MHIGPGVVIGNNCKIQNHSLIYEGVYRPEYPKIWLSEQEKLGYKLPEFIKNSTDLGHNGTWTYSFGTPFYMWLLENLY